MGDSTKPTVMIVDDSKFVRAKLRDIFEEGGYDVVAEAWNGTEAVRKYQENKPNLLTMDIVMPEIEGIEAAKQILAIDPSAVIVMVSSLGMESKIKEALKVGAKNFIIKPFEPQRILEVTEQVLKSCAHVNV
ncbi:MAG: response regulator [Nitrospirales bacterium]